jgi:hypothetical protein
VPRLRNLVLPIVRHGSLRAARLLRLPLSLERLGAIAGTDKVDPHHTHNGLSNCAVYEKYLRRRRRRSFGLLEIGVYNGASLRMWRAYFRRARVIGLDIDPRVEMYRGEGFDIFIGSQSDPVVLDRAVTPDVEVVIDDGSHVNELSIATFKHVFPRLPSGAIYVIEDTIPSYEPAWWDWPGMRYNNPNLSLDNKREDLDELLAELYRDCDLRGHERTVAFVHVWPGTIVIGRA